MSDKKEPLFYYNPSLHIEIGLATAFVLTTLLHSFQLLKHRCWYFIPFVIGGIFECLGFGARAALAKQTPDWKLGAYVTQSLLTLLAPPLFAASIYMTLSRIIRLTSGQHLSIVPVKWLTMLFVTGDVVSFFVQSAGGGILANAKTEKEHDLGRILILVGLSIQVVFFLFFIAVSATFHMRIRQSPTLASANVGPAWKKCLVTLYVSSCLILVRSIFRFIEYAMGRGGPLMKKEMFMIMFDAVPMLMTMQLFNLFHPSRALNEDHATEPSHDLETSNAGLQRKLST